jgi:hypothetical protein
LKAVLVELRAKTYDIYIYEAVRGEAVKLRLSWRLNALSIVLCCSKEQERARRSFISTQVRIPCEMEKITRIRIHVGLSTRFCCCFDLMPERVLSTESVRHSLYAPRDLDLFFSSVAPTQETFSTTQTPPTAFQQCKHRRKTPPTVSNNTFDQHLPTPKTKMTPPIQVRRPKSQPTSSALRIRAIQVTNTSEPTATAGTQSTTNTGTQLTTGGQPTAAGAQSTNTSTTISAQKARIEALKRATQALEAQTAALAAELEIKKGVLEEAKGKLRGLVGRNEYRRRMGEVRREVEGDGKKEREGE